MTETDRWRELAMEAERQLKPCRALVEFISHNTGEPTADWPVRIEADADVVGEFMALLDAAESTLGLTEHKPEIPPLRLPPCCEG